MINIIKDNLQKSIDCKKQFLEDKNNIQIIEETLKKMLEEQQKMILIWRNVSYLMC